MENCRRESTSIWMATEPRPEAPPLQADLTLDVCVVGAGMAGLSTAYHLARQGRTVAVLDAAEIGGLETAHTTAHLASVLDDRFSRLARLHTDEDTRLAAASHQAAIDSIEEIVNREGIDCGFERLDGFLFSPESTSAELAPILRDELAVLERMGRPEVEVVETAPFPSFRTGRALRFPRQAQFHPLRYTQGLVRGIRAGGGQVYGQSRVMEIHGGDTPWVVTEGGHTVRAKWLAVCTNTPVNDRVKIHTKQAGYRTYVIGASVPHGSIRKALYWDTLDPYHYIRLVEGGPASREDTLIIGGEDHKTGQAEHLESRFETLEAWARSRFPEITRFTHRWSGQVMEPADGLAFIGRNPGDENVLIATGDSGNGMTHGAIAGILLSDLVQGRPNPWQDLYDPGRKRLKAVPELSRENLNTFRQYTDWLKPSPAREDAMLAPGEGRVVQEGVHKVALYRDEEGEIHACSAVCPHLGGIVHWNSFEKSWDCPAHGSRFDGCGRVLHGPALKDLGKPERQKRGA